MRLLAKTIFEAEFVQCAGAELCLKTAKAMPGGLFDQYLLYVVSRRYMAADGQLDWTAFKDNIETLISALLRAEGAAAAAAAPAADGMHLG